MAILSSDDDEILATGPSNIRRLKRPDELAQDDTPTEPVIEHTLVGVDADVVVLLQPTSPVRRGIEIDGAVDMLLTGMYDSIVSVVPSHAFLWWAVAPTATYNWAKRPRRQEMGNQYEENGSIYAFTMAHWRKTRNRIGGRIGLYVMREESRIQVDSALDLYLCDAILRREQWVLKSSPKLA